MGSLKPQALSILLFLPSMACWLFILSWLQYIAATAKIFTTFKDQKWQRVGGLGWPDNSQAERPSPYTPLAFYPEQNPPTDFPLYIIVKNGIICSPLKEARTMFLIIKGSLPNIWIRWGICWVSNYRGCQSPHLMIRKPIFLPLFHDASLLWSQSVRLGSVVLPIFHSISDRDPADRIAESVF